MKYLSFVSAPVVVASALLFAPMPSFALSSGNLKISDVLPSISQAGVMQTFMTSVDGATTGIDFCDFYLGSDKVGSMKVTGTTASFSYAFPVTGVYTVTAFCKDKAGNISSSMPSSVWAQPVAATSVPPTVGKLDLKSAMVGVPTNVSVSVNAGADANFSCKLGLGQSTILPMTIADGKASASVTFPTVGTAVLDVVCADSKQHMNSMGQTMINVLSVSDAGSAPAPAPAPAPASNPDSGFTHAVGLVKLSCATATTGCKVVYFVSADGKRHPFINQKVFSTWYADFSSVTEISAAEMSSHQLGAPVLYRPGVRLVKFNTLPKVYAIGKGGVLRWIANEGVARGLYGTTWNKNIDLLPDTSVTNYSFGDDISAIDQFNPSGERDATPGIEQNTK
jgi:hypothetical protein